MPRPQDHLPCELVRLEDSFNTAVERRRWRGDYELGLPQLRAIYLAARRRAFWAPTHSGDRHVILLEQFL